MRKHYFIIAFVSVISIIAWEDYIQHRLGIGNYTDGIIFYENFEEGDFSKWSWFENCYDYEPDERAIEIVNDPIDFGNAVATMRNTDEDAPFNGGHPRSEIVYDRRITGTNEERYSWKFMVDSEHDNDSTWEVIGQWYAVHDECNGETWRNWEYADASPPVGLFLNNDEVYVVLNNARLGKVVESRNYRIQKGEWVDFKCNIGWSTEEDGYFEGWINGEPIVFDYYGSHERYSYPTLLNDIGNIFKLGTYRERASGGQSIVYYDDIIIEDISKWNLILLFRMIWKNITKQDCF